MAWHGMGVMKYACIILVGTPRANRPLGWPRPRLGKNMKP
jgi:hypothetical protein